MRDWLKEPRDAVEAAAWTGDEGAQAALRLHRALDRVDAQLASTRATMHAGFDALEQEIRALKQQATKHG